MSMSISIYKLRAPECGAIACSTSRQPSDTNRQSAPRCESSEAPERYTLQKRGGTLPSEEEEEEEAEEGEEASGREVQASASLLPWKVSSAIATGSSV